MVPIQSTRAIHVLCVIGVLSLLTPPFGTCAGPVVPATVEDLVQESEMIVLGRVIATDPEAISLGRSNQIYTRHTLAVETYYMGSGPMKISLLTHGGTWTKRVGDEEHKQLTQVLGAVGVREGEDFLAFLKPAPDGYDGYVFVEWDGAKYLVDTNAEGSDRTISLRLRKKKYMKGIALEGFERMERRRTDYDNPTAQVEKELIGSKGIADSVSIAELRGRLAEIIRGETAAS